jgi:formamidopyrimidine-DNA glycosylase
MPELPEVETTRRGLQPRIQGRRILRAELRLPKLLRAAPAAGLKALEGRRILGLRRRAKHLWMDVEGGWTLCVHLGMSGQLTWWDHACEDSAGFMRHRHTGLEKTPGQHAPDRHTHFLLHLQGGDRVQYRDPRQFGCLRLLPTAQLELCEPFKSLGPEPLDPAFTPQAFAQRLRRLAQSLTPGEAEALFASLRAVLEQGIALGGTSISDYVNAEGKSGGNQEQLKAYGRAGRPCLRCGTALKHTLVSQRSTVFCPHCQPLGSARGRSPRTKPSKKA